MILFLCFTPFFLLVFGILIGFVTVHFGYNSKRARMRRIPPGVWSISYRNHDYIV